MELQPPSRVGQADPVVAPLLAMTGVPREDLEVAACSLNHFGWYQSIRHRKTGEDLYPLLKERERKAHWMARWDGYALARMLLRTYGLLAYPVTNHIGEYFRWADNFIASPNMQFFHDLVSEAPWTTGKLPHLVYFAEGYKVCRYFDSPDKDEFRDLQARFTVPSGDLVPSAEDGVPLISSLVCGHRTDLLTVNVLNRGRIPGLPDDLCVELPAFADGSGLHPRAIEPLPAPVAEMIRVQAVIHGLLIEAYVENSRNKLLQALLLDPTTTSYQGAVATINEMFARQEKLLPPLVW